MSKKRKIVPVTKRQKHDREFFQNDLFLLPCFFLILMAAVWLSNYSDPDRVLKYYEPGQLNLLIERTSNND